MRSEKVKNKNGSKNVAEGFRFPLCNERSRTKMEG